MLSGSIKLFSIFYLPVVCATLTVFVNSEKLVEKVCDLPEKAYDTTLMTVVAAKKVSTAVTVTVLRKIGTSFRYRDAII